MKQPSALRMLVALAVIDCLDVKTALAGNKLFEHRHSEERNRRNREILERKLADRKAIVARLFQTRHHPPLPLITDH